MSDSCSITLMASRWTQIVSYEAVLHGPRELYVTTRSNSECNLTLTNDKRVREMEASFSIAIGEPILGNGKRLERGIGLYSFFKESDSGDQFSKAHTGGWLMVDSGTYHEIWEQVRDFLYFL